MPPIHTLENLYNELRHCNYEIAAADATTILTFLTRQLKQSKPESFIQALNVREQQAIKSGQISLCHIMLTLHAFSISETKDILAILSDETLQQPGVPVHLRFHKTDINTPLGMAMMGCATKAKRVWEEQEHKAIQIKWREHIVDYLLNERHLSPDIDILCGGQPLPIYCLLEAKQNPLLFYPLAFDIIEKIADVNRQHQLFGGTALNFAAAIGDEELMRLLLRKGADFTLSGSNGWSAGSKKAPLLIATERGNIGCVRMLLEAGASPNAIPYNPLKNIKSFREEVVLTPYQTAVELKNQVLVKLFVAHAKRHRIQLQYKLDPDEQARRNAAGITQGRGCLTLGAQAEAEAIRNNDTMLRSIYNDFHVQCYVEDVQDRPQVEQALRWLFEEKTLADCVGFTYWNPIRTQFLAESRTNDKLTIFVHGEGRETAGCFNADTQNDVYLEGGGSTYHYKHVIAHELGHYFAVKKSGHLPVPPNFEAPYLADKAAYDQGTKPHLLLQKLFNDVDLTEHYNDDTAKLAEYFTRACVQFPIQLYLSDPKISPEDFETTLQRSMPHMLDYFQTRCMGRGPSVADNVNNYTAEAPVKRQ
jgi:hypothetical protein